MCDVTVFFETYDYNVDRGLAAHRSSNNAMQFHGHGYTINCNNDISNLHASLERGKRVGGWGGRLCTMRECVRALACARARKHRRARESAD